jgi:hypothetical protein
MLQLLQVSCTNERVHNDVECQGPDPDDQASNTSLTLCRVGWTVHQNLADISPNLLRSPINYVCLTHPETPDSYKTIVPAGLAAGLCNP